MVSPLREFIEGFMGSDSSGRPSESPTSGSILRRMGGITLGTAALIGVSAYALCTKYVRPNEYGIMQVDVPLMGMFGKKGIHENVYETGVYLEVPGCQKIHKFPKDIQVLSLSATEKINDDKKEYTRVIPAAHIQTSDGFFIDLDVSIMYRIKDPVKVIKNLGAGKLYEDNGIIPRAEPILKETLGQLNPEDFYNSERRVNKQDEAMKLFNERLSPLGLEVEHVLVRYPKYHPQVQERIEGRKLQDQLAFKNQSESLQSAAEAELKKTVSLGEAAMKVELEKGKAYITTKTADIDLYKRTKYAEGNKLVKLAGAERTQLINEAYEGIGSERMVGIEMAEVLEGLETIVIPVGGENGMNPLNIDQTIDTLLGNGSTTKEVKK